MIEALTNGDSPTVGRLGPSLPAQADVNAFSQLLEVQQPAPAALQNFVNSAENRIERGQLAVSAKLKEFDMKDSMLSLVNAMHESTMNSVSVQLTSKIGSKVTDSFEQLIKQQ